MTNWKYSGSGRSLTNRTWISPLAGSTQRPGSVSSYGRPPARCANWTQVPVFTSRTSMSGSASWAGTQPSAEGSQRGCSVAATGFPPGIVTSPLLVTASCTFVAPNVPSNGSGRQAIRASPVPSWIDHGSREKKFASASTTLLRRRSPEKVVVPPIVNGSGTSYRTLATARTCWPSMSVGRTGSVPHARSWMLSPGSDHWAPVIGSKLSWSMIDRRTRLRCWVSSRLDPSNDCGPTTRSESEIPLMFGLGGIGSLTLTVAPAGMSSSLATDRPSTSAGDSSVRSERLVIVPVTGPPSSRSDASTIGPLALPSARIVRSDPKPTSRSRTRDGSPSSTSSPAPVPPPKMSPFIGVARSASPSTLSWNVAREGLKIPR